MQTKGFGFFKYGNINCIIKYVAKSSDCAWHINHGIIRTYDHGILSRGISEI